jgi:hypothetical protein
MEILSKRIYEVLKDKGVTSIYHANSVIASCHFLRNRCLLSRGSVDKLGLFQTSKISKLIGRNYGIWDDIFADTADIHKLAGSQNSRGPVLFELDIEIIKNTYTGKVWVTKSHPIDWEMNTNHERRWFVSSNDLDHYFSYGDADHMAVFRHCGGKLPIQNHLKSIILDDPKICTLTDQIDYFSMAYGAIRLAMTEGGIEVPIVKRVCADDCGCLESYQSGIGHTEKLFIPHLLK